MTEITKLEVGKLETNCYVVSSNGVAFVVDPGAEAERIFDHCNSHSLKVEGILLTHGHYDHSGAVKKLQNLTGAKIYATAECDDLANSYKSMAFAFGATAVRATVVRVVRVAFARGFVRPDARVVCARPEFERTFTSFIGATGSANTVRIENKVEQTKNAPAKRKTVPMAFLNEFAIF